ncbi:AsmA family protein [Coraliomargarita sp. W4R53]
MKTLVRIFLIFVVLLVIAAGVGFFVVTRPGFQKKLVESKLPAGSSIKFVKVSTGSLELIDLKLQLADGTTAKLDRLSSKFSPMAAIFHDTIELHGLTVDGLVVKLPEVAAASAASPVPAPSGQPSSTESVSSPAAPPATAEESSSPTDALYALGDLDFLFDIDSITLNGSLIDASRNRYVFDVNSDSIAPGRETTVEAALKLESKQALQGGLKDFVSDARLIFSQKQSGGFEQLRIESQTLGSDANGGALISISQTLELAINGFEESASVALSFNADLSHPEVFAPELIALQGLSLQGELKGSAEGSALTLETADLDAASNGTLVASIKLKQSLTLGAEQKFVGELMQVSLINLPFAWLNPWLSNGMQLSGAPISAQIALSGEGSGALEVKTLAPLQVGPFSLTQNDQALLQDVTLRLNPVIRVEADQTIRYDLGDFQLLDGYGAVLSGTVSGSKRESAEASPLAGLQTNANFDVGIAELLQQPALAGVGSVLAGQAKISLDVDGAAEYPAKLQAVITGLRARDQPGSRQDYRLAAQLKESGNGSYALGSNFQAGSDTRPSTSIQLAGQLNLEQQPMPFKINLTGPRVLQSDFDLLLAALQSQAVVTEPTMSAPSRPTATVSSPRGSASPSRVTSQSAQPISQRPPWADLDGEVAVKIDSLVLTSGQTITGLSAQAKIAEALLSVSDITAMLEGGGLGGNAQVAFDPNLNKAYKVSSALTFKNVDPSIFSKNSSESFPVKGLFDGNLNLTGSGVTLEQALEDSDADLLVSGRDGLLTAFELDNRSQLGLLGAGILGQSLNRPGITAMAQAVPYFKDMKFSSFTLKLTRAQDKKVRIPELKFIGDNLRINGQGIIAASRLDEVLDQPLDLTLGLGAKGRLIEYLETLQLLSANTNEDGFRDWSRDIKIGGTLGDPDTSALKDLLNDAARRALEKSDKSSSPTTPAVEDGVLPGQQLDSVPQEKKKSKDEKRRDDIEMGLDLLNSVFG